MKRPFFLWVAFVALMACVAGAAPQAGVASPASHAGACGTSSTSHDLVEPPNVEAWRLPVDASGERELILAVRKDGDRFCYQYTANGTVHSVAPTIRVRRGEHFALRIVNDIAGQSRGETVASTAIPSCLPMAMPAAKTTHYAGYLNHTIDDRYMHAPPIDTNIHLHGFQGPASEENIFLSTLSTPMHACEYRVTIPRTQPPGTYLYHPHAHGSSDDEVAGGLDGAWIVEPDAPQIARSAEHVVLLRYRIPFILDNPFAPDGDAFSPAAATHEAALALASPAPYDPFNPPPWPVTFPMRAGGESLDSTGCNGLASEVLVSADGSDTPASLHVPAGQPQLLRILNGTSDSATLLRIHDSSGRHEPMHVVGLDGVPVSGNMERPLAQYIAMKEVMLTSMSRADVLVTVDPGQSITLSSEHYCQGADGFFEMHHDLLDVVASPNAATESVALNATPVRIADTPAAQLVAYARANPSLIRKRALTFTEYLFPKKGKVPPHYGFYITETTNPNFHEHPFWPVYASKTATVPSNPDIVVKKGSVEEWYLVNATLESHAFHIHQMAFVVEKSFTGIPLTRDTVFLPVGRVLPNRRDPNYPLVKPHITRILLDFRNVRRGEFVFHCHMLFHEDRGMMAVIRVV